MDVDEINEAATLSLQCERQLSNGIVLQIDNNGGYLYPSQQTFERFAPSSSSNNSSSRSSRRNQNITLDNLLGQAVILAARGDATTAMAILYEVIRQDPRMPDGYLQLAEIYENQDDQIKSFEYRLLGCLVSTKTSADQWNDTGELALKLHRLEDAAACFTKASRVDRKNWTYYEKRITAYESLGLINEVMKTKLEAAQFVDCFSFEWLEQTILESSCYFKVHEDVGKMIYALRILIQRCKQFEIEYGEKLEVLINKCLELHDYHRIVQVILGFCDGISATDDKGNLVYEVADDYTLRPYPFTRQIAQFEISYVFPTSMLTRLIICFLNLEMIPAAKSLIDALLQRPIDMTVIDSYLQIATDLLSIKDDVKGLEYTSKLLSEEPNLAGVWFLQGCFQHSLQDLDNALDSYNKTLELQDDHIDARVNISSIYQSRGDMKKALDILRDYSLDNCSYLPDERLLIQQVEIFRQQKNKTQYISVIRMILVPYFYQLIQQQELILIGPKKKKLQFCATIRRLAFQKLEKSALKAFVKRLGAATEMNQNFFQSLKTQDLFDSTLKLAEALFEEKMYTEMFHLLCFAALHRQLPEINFQALEQLLLLSSSKSKNFDFTFELLRSSIKQMVFYTKDITRLSSVSLSMGFVVAQYQHYNIQKFLHRTFEIFPENMHFLMLSANCSLIAGSYKYALSQYSYILKQRPDDPLALLLSSICFLNMSVKRATTGRISLVNRAIVSIGKYRDSRAKAGPKQEIFYNMGRLFHQIGFSTQAIYWYEKVLNESDPLVAVEDSITGDQTFVPCLRYSLKPLAALNYIDIIKQKNPGKARQLRRKYCVL